MTTYLYVGCGHHRIPGFTHVEINVAKQFKKGDNLTRPEIIADITEKIPLPSHSVDLIFSRATLEHLTYPELINHFIECNRLLKKDGGVIRMVVPDLDKMIDDYQNRIFEQPGEIDPNLPVENFTDYFIWRLLYHDHYYLHNFDTLSRALEKSGFTHARRCQPGETAVERAKGVLKEAEINRSGDLIVEAIRLKDSTVSRFRSDPSLHPVNRFLAGCFNLKIVPAFKRRPTVFRLSWWIAWSQRRPQKPVNALDFL